MFSPRETPPPVPVNGHPSSSPFEEAKRQKKLLTTARFCIVASLLLAGVIAYLFPYAQVYILPACLPYLANLVLLPRRRALAAATVIGAVGMVAPLWGFLFALHLVIDPYRDWEVLAVLPALGLLLLSHVGLIISASSYRKLLAPPADGKKPRGVTILAIGYFFCVIVFVAVTLPTIYRDSKSANENSAVSSLRTLNTRLSQYQASYPAVGYPARLADLGQPQSGKYPSATAAALVDETLACTNPPCTKSGYLFEYRTSGKAGVNDVYEISARPVRYHQSGLKSFSAQSGWSDPFYSGKSRRHCRGSATLSPSLVLGRSFL